VSRRCFVVGLVAGALAWPATLFAQGASPKLIHIGYLTIDPVAIDMPRREGFLQGLRDLGYIEGKNISIEYRCAEGNYEHLPNLAGELARRKVDLMFAFSPLAVQAAKDAMPMVPIVSITPDPVAHGFAASYRQPAGLVTGLASLVGTEIYAKYLELLKETVPNLTRVAFLSNSKNPLNGNVTRDMDAAASSLKVSLHILDARTPDEIDRAFAEMGKQRFPALVVMQDGMFLSQRKRIADLAAATRMPAIYTIQEHAEAGGLMAYATNRPMMFRSAANYVDKVLKGAKPGDLPIERPTTFDLVVNLAAAKGLGLTMPPSIMVRATRVIQ